MAPLIASAVLGTIIARTASGAPARNECASRMVVGSGHCKQATGPVKGRAGGGRGDQLPPSAAWNAAATLLRSLGAFG